MFFYAIFFHNFQELRHQVVGSDRRSLGMSLAFSIIIIVVFILTVFLARIFQFIVSSLTVRKVFVVTNGNFLCNGIVVGTIVGDV